MSLNVAVVAAVDVVVAVVVAVSADDAVIYYSLLMTIRCSNCWARLYWQNDPVCVDTD